MSHQSTSPFLVDGLSVGIVRYPDGTFRQVAPGHKWVEDAYNWHPRKSTFRYVETLRSKAAVLLYDPSRKINILLDLVAQRVALMAGRPVKDFSLAAKTFTNAHPILDATVASDLSMFEITGLTVGVVAYESGVFRRTGSGHFWVEEDLDNQVVDSFREIGRTLDSVTLQAETHERRVTLDFTDRSIRRHTTGDQPDKVHKFTSFAIAEPLGVMLKSFFVVSEGDFGDDEEVYGRFTVKAIGPKVSSRNAEERDLYNETKAIAIKKGESHEFTDMKVLYYGLHEEDTISISGWLKEKDPIGDDDLGFSQTVVDIADLEDEDTVLVFENGDTKVEAHFHISRNYHTHIARHDGFLPVRTTSHGVRNEPRFAGVVPMGHRKTRRVSEGVNVLPDGPESSTVNGLRFTVIVGVGFVPYVGGLLSEVVDLLWPDGEMDGWDEIKGRAEALMKNLIVVERVHDLEKRLRGLKQTIDDYRNTSMGSAEKGSWMVNVMSSLNGVQPFFFDERNPEYMLPYLVALGTLTLAVMREQIVCYKEIYGREDTDAEYKMKEMKERLEEYSAAVRKGMDGARAWRERLVVITKRDGKYVVVDELSGYESMEYRKRPEVLYRNVLQCVKNSFGMKLVDMVQAATVWKYMVPQASGRKMTRSLVRTTSGPFPVGRFTERHTSVTGKRMSGMRISVDDGHVEGFEIWYEGEAEAGAVFGELKRGKVDRMELEDGEVVIGVSGCSEDVLKAFWMFTSFGRCFGGGGGGGNGSDGKGAGGFEWTGAPNGPDGYLEGVFGVQGGFGFTWACYNVE